jgi:hypothetical protein
LRASTSGIGEHGHEAVPDEIGHGAAPRRHLALDEVVILGDAGSGAFVIIGQQGAVRDDVGVERRDLGPLGGVGGHANS